MKIEKWILQACTFGVLMSIGMLIAASISNHWYEAIMPEDKKNSSSFARGILGTWGFCWFYRDDYSKSKNISIPFLFSFLTLISCLPIYLPYILSSFRHSWENSKKFSSALLSLQVDHFKPKQAMSLSLYSSFSFSFISLYIFQSYFA